MSTSFKIHVSDSERSGEADPAGSVLEFPSIEDALFRSFQHLDAGDIVWSITGPDIELTRNQIVRKWRAARQ